MKLRPYVADNDFDFVKNWVTDERTNAMWSANHAPFPLERASFDAFLSKMFREKGDFPFTAITDEGEPVGFICCSFGYDTKEAMLAFVLIDPSQRGKGCGREMISLAAKYCFEMLGAEAVQLNVFTVNERAKKCYESAGFTERRTDPDAFPYKDGKWGRCNMVMKREEY